MKPPSSDVFGGAISLSPDAPGVLWRELEAAHAERERLAGALRRAEGREALGQLAAGIVHDFNNLLTVIGAYSQLLRRRAKDGDEDLRRSLEGIETAVKSGSALTRGALAAYRRQALPAGPLDLGQALAALAPVLTQLVGRGVTLHLETGTREVAELTAAVGPVRLAPGEADQLFLNLASNARDAMPGGGRLTFGVSELEFPEPVATALGPLAAGRYVRLAVTDTGVGMDADTRARLFEPHFTTKAEGRGHGLGLCTVAGIVGAAGGGIGVESAPGAGTTITILLPRLEAAAAREVAELTTKSDISRGR